MSRTSAFETTLLPHLDAAYNLARWLTRNDQDAEDVVQEAYVRALRYFGSFDGGAARPWLLGIVRNTCYTWLEKNRPAELVAVEDVDALPADLEAPASVAGNPEVILLQSAQKKLVNQALEELPVVFREVVVMREIEDMSYKEIAAVAGVPVGTVMSRLARGRDLLRRAIERRERRAS
jgi:RNA polymerase sigma-70 factor (ECF subfamily)